MRSAQEAETMNGLKLLTDSRRSTFRHDVDRSDWSGMPVRNLANEPDCVDFYNYVHSPLGG